VKCIYILPKRSVSFIFVTQTWTYYRCFQLFVLKSNQSLSFSSLSRINRSLLTLSLRLWFISGCLETFCQLSKKVNDRKRPTTTLKKTKRKTKWWLYTWFLVSWVGLNFLNNGTSVQFENSLHQKSDEPTTTVLHSHTYWGKKKNSKHRKLSYSVSNVIKKLWFLFPIWFILLVFFL